MPRQARERSESGIKKEERDDIIRKIKDIQGVTIRQLARIPGISKSVIDRM